MRLLEKREIKYLFVKYSFILYILLFLLLVLVLIVLINISFCNDWTPERKCADLSPLFCENGLLVEKASVCGCPENLTIENDLCVSEYWNGNSKKLYLDYFIGKKNGYIDFIADEGFYNHIKTIPRFISSQGDSMPANGHFHLMRLENEEQREMLLPLVMKIKSITGNEDKQAKIAISLVQSLDYSELDGSLWGKASSFRYPYEVLYDKSGSCGEKSELLALLLRELGYETAIFYFKDEQHEAVGIKCPSYMDHEDTGYCFIETTGVLENRKYLGATQNFKSMEVIKISDGKSIGFFF